MNPRSWRLRRPRLGTVLGGLALFIALQGTAFALPGLNSVDSGDIAPNQVRSSDLGIISPFVGAPVAVNPGVSASAVATCPGGAQVMSVGYQRANSGVTVGNIEILGTSTARVTGYNHTGAPINLQARAFCLQP